MTKSAAALYLVATPIGNLGDMTLRGVEVLKTVDIIACEDTRQTAKLLNHFGIRTKTISYHDHNAAQRRPELLAILEAGKSVALVSDAGTPLVSDPGYKLVQAATDAGVRIIPIPGASSVLAALCISGAPSDAFTFLGFLPTTASQAKHILEVYNQVPSTLILFESPRRLGKTLTMLREVLGDRQAAICRELTKLYEEAKRAPLSEVAAHYVENETKGEVVIVIHPPSEMPQIDDAIIQDALRQRLKHGSLKQAVSEVSEALNVPRNRVYKLALSL